MDFSGQPTRNPDKVCHDGDKGQHKSLKTTCQE